jgi:hypothetical protein
MKPGMKKQYQTLVTTTIREEEVGNVATSRPKQTEESRKMKNNNKEQQSWY